MSTFFGGKYHRFFLHKNTGSPSCQCSACVSLSKGSTSTTYTPEKCLDFSQGSWSILLTRGKRWSTWLPTLTLWKCIQRAHQNYIHTRKMPVFLSKSCRLISDGNVDDFFGANIDDFFTQKYWPMLSVWKFMERAHQYYIQIRKMPGILSRKLINFFDTRKTPNLFKGHTSRARTTYKPERFFQKSCRILRQKCRRFLRRKYRRLFRRKYRRFFRHKNG